MKDANAAIRDLLDHGLGHALRGRGHAQAAAPERRPVVLEPGDLDVVSEGVEGRRAARIARRPRGTTRRTVALDTALDDALKAEGLTREFVNRVQNLRKEAGFDVADRIAVEFAPPPALAGHVGLGAEAGGAGGDGALAAAFSEPVRAETLAESLAVAEAPAGDLVRDVEIGGETFPVAVRKL